MELAAADLERIRRKEIRELDTYKTVSLLCHSADYKKPPYAPKPWSGLVEQHIGSKRPLVVNEVIQAAAELQAICESKGWRFCFIGVALQRWDDPRETVDVDLSLFVGFGEEQNSSISFSNTRGTNCRCRSLCPTATSAAPQIRYRCRP